MAKTEEELKREDELDMASCLRWSRTKRMNKGRCKDAAPAPAITGPPAG